MTDTALMIPDAPQEVIDWVNEIRYRRGIGEPLKKLPGGFRKWARGCPLHYALSAGNVTAVISYVQVGFVLTAYDDDFLDTIDVPDFVADWLRKFDEGKDG